MHRWEPQLKGCNSKHSHSLATGSMPAGRGSGRRGRRRNCRSLGRHWVYRGSRFHVRRWQDQRGVVLGCCPGSGRNWGSASRSTCTRSAITSIDAAEHVGAFVIDAAEHVSDAAEHVGAFVIDAAEQVSDFAVDAGNEVKDAVNTVANKVEKAANSVGRFLGNLFG